MAADSSSPKQTQALPDEKLVAETVRTRLPFHAELKAIAPLAGDASNRRYFRIQLGAGSFPSLILMQLAEPEAFKQSEEAVSGGAPPTELPFVNVHRHLIQAQVPVPQLYHYDKEAGLLYLEDLGDVTLAQACENGAGEQAPGFYRYAVDVLVSLHLKATFPPDPACVAFGRAFDVPLLMWEFDHFIEYGIEKRNGRLIPEADRHAIRNDMQKAAGLLAGLPQVFTHRDYHSRNLMVREGRLRVIDFQDALMGPATYDLASLLRDSYVALDEDLINELVIRYLEGRAKAGAPLDRLTFMRLFDLTSIQRNLKAAGRFVYIDQVKGNPKFLADIPRTLGYVRRNLAKYPETAALRKKLALYVPELR